MFVDCCTSLLDLFTPIRSPKKDEVDLYIDRLEKRISNPHLDSNSFSKKLTKAVLRRKTLSELKLDFRNPRTFFRYSNSRLKEHSSIPTLLAGTVQLSSSVEKANHLATHFASVFTPLSLPDDIPALSSRARSATRLPDRYTVFPEELVADHLATLSSKSSSTLDRIPPIFFKTIRLFLAEPLSLIFQRSYEEGDAPMLFRTGLVTPIFKKGLRDQAENYRPVSQAVIPCLIFEKILAKHLLQYLSINELLDANQHGFVPKKSTDTQLLLMTQEFA